MKRFIGCIALLIFGVMSGWLLGHGIPYPPLDRTLPSYTFPNTTITIEHQVDPGFMEISDAMGGKFWKFAVTTTKSRMPSSDPKVEVIAHQMLEVVLVEYLNEKEVSAEVLGTFNPLHSGGRAIVTFGLLPMGKGGQLSTFSQAAECLLVQYQHIGRKRGEAGWTADRWRNTIPNPFLNNGYSIGLGQSTTTSPNEYRLVAFTLPRMAAGESRRRYLVLRPRIIAITQQKTPDA